MAYLTFSDLSDLRKSHGFVKLAKSLQEEVTAAVSGKTVFLSHKHDETKLIEEVEAFFRKLGAEVYVDWKDPDMPPVTSPETAELLRSKIISSNKFLVLATERATASRWVSWELGYADGVKATDEVALLPICADSGTWPEREYFGAYNRVSKSDKGNWCVWSPKNKFISYLNDWLSS